MTGAMIVGGAIALFVVWFVIERVPWYWLVFFLAVCSMVSGVVGIFVPWW